MTLTFSSRLFAKVFYLLIIGYMPVLAQGESVYDRLGIFAHVDQDFFYPSKNEDRNYTMGAAIGFMGKSAGKINLLNLIKINWPNFMPIDSVKNINAVTLGYGAFTPLDLASVTPVTNDRPYGGILALSSSRLIYKESQEELNPFPHAFYGSYTIGILGTNIGNWFQSWVHQRRIDKGIGNRVVPQGWHNQISNGGELTGMLTVGHKRLISTSSNARVEKVWKVIGMSELNLGYHTNATLGLTTTLGNLRDWFSFNINPTSIISEKTGDTNKARFFFFATGRIEYVFYNALLQGQFKNNPYELTSKQVKHIIAIYDIGANVALGTGTNIRFQLTRRSPEYVINLTEGRSHFWGSIYLSQTFNNNK